MIRILITSFLFLICCSSLAWGQHEPQARIQGTVVLAVLINETGDVSRMKVVSGHPMLVPAAIDAVKQWKYRPYEENGEPIEIQTTIQVNFTLADKSPAGSILGGTVGDTPAQALGLVRMCEEVPAGSTPGRVPVSQGLIQGIVISKQAPNYPNEARQQKVEGTVPARFGNRQGWCRL